MHYTKYFLSTALPIIAIFVLLGLSLQPLTGDLTRLGYFSENDFGWNLKMPRIAIKEISEKTNPTVLVIGDSFSLGNCWQSVVMGKSREKILTIHMLDPCDIDSFMPMVKKRYPSVRYIIFETVQRSFLGRINEDQHQNFNGYVKPVYTGSFSTDEGRDISLIHEMHDPIYAVKATVNSFKNFNHTERSGDVIISPLNTNDLFSCKKSCFLIYYKDDDVKKDWKYSDVKNTVTHLKRLSDIAAKDGINFVVMVVPDKSTVYGKSFLYPQFKISPPDIWSEIQRQGVNQINLLNVFVQEAYKTKDFYLPDDTHLSSKGYIVMGNTVEKYLDTTY
ncbi:MAG: hypothetical protein HGB36_10890 [Chlorobiaceae bacterium]|nr:hypothetical protein [Chlorobiaceae bacterium]